MKRYMAIAAPLVILLLAGLAVLGWVVGSGGSPSAKRSHFRSFRQLAFAYPASWRQTECRREESGEGLGTETLVYLGSASSPPRCSDWLHQPRLRRDGVILMWGDYVVPYVTSLSQFPGKHTRIDGQPARIAIKPASEECSKVSGTRTIKFVIRLPNVASNWGTMTACLRGPHLSTLEAQIRRMLASVKLKGPRVAEGVCGTPTTPVGRIVPDHGTVKIGLGDRSVGPLVSVRLHEPAKHLTGGYPRGFPWRMASSSNPEVLDPRSLCHPRGNMRVRIATFAPARSNAGTTHLHAALRPAWRALPPSARDGITSYHSTVITTVNRSCRAAEPVLRQWRSTPNALLDLKFISSSRGFALAVGRILATRDGGARWQVQKSSPTAQWSSLDVLDASQAWVVGAHRLLATKDGGRHWTALPQRCPPIRAVDFISPRRGFALASRGGWAPPAATLLETRDGGRSWHRLPSPRGAQSLCFQNARDGFLGAAGNIYATADGGRHWTLSMKGLHPHVGRKGSPVPGLVHLRCASHGAWAEIVGPGGESSQQAHIAYHYHRGSWNPIFAEQYFPHPGVRVSRQSPGSYPAAFSAISASAAAFVDSCSACVAHAQAPIAIATDGGAKLIRTGNVEGISNAIAASFISASQGWVAGVVSHRSRWLRSGVKAEEFRIVHTTDGGRTWHTQYRAGP